MSVGENGTSMADNANVTFSILLYNIISRLIENILIKDSS